MEVVEIFKNLGWPLDQIGDDWTVLGRNVNQGWRVSGRLVKILRREWAKPNVAEMFYRAVT